MQQLHFKQFRGARLLRADHRATGTAIMLNCGSGTPAEIRAACQRSGCRPTARTRHEHARALWVGVRP